MNNATCVALLKILLGHLCLHWMNVSSAAF